MSQTETTAETQPKAPMQEQHSPAKQPTTQGTSLLLIVTVAAAFSAFSGYLSWHFATKKAFEMATSAPVVLLDSARIAEKKIEESMTTANSSPEKAVADGKAFITALDKTLSEYTAAGIVVVNSSVAINRPAHLDITKDVAARLNVKLD
jgi:hypothetical protein